MKVLVVEHLLRLPEATRILRLFKQKKHADAGYFFDLQDLGCSINHAFWHRRGVPEPYNPNASGSQQREDAYVLRVYRTIPDR